MSMLSIFRTKEPAMPKAAPVDRPALNSAHMEKHPASPMHEDHLAEYAKLAATVGVKPPELAIETFKAVLVSLDIPIFFLAEVIKYMDAKAAKESKEKAGWEWRPLRAKDNAGMAFGTEASATSMWSEDQGRYTRIIPASDFYRGPATTTFLPSVIFGTVVERSEWASPVRVYDRTVPLHALRRVAAIENEYKGPLAFMVSDYALAPQIQYPDPFLMAVVPNVDVRNGTGRFVIDFWDEPGFGIEQMLK